MQLTINLTEADAAKLKRYMEITGEDNAEIEFKVAAKCWMDKRIKDVEELNKRSVSQ